MIIFRLCRNKFSEDLSGNGAKKSGGRWNSKGTPVVYCSESRALCLAETAVNLSLDLLPDDFCMVSIFVPDDALIKAVDESQLPADWQLFPHPYSTQLIGDKFCLDRKFLLMKVPSCVVPYEFNYLLNPTHPDFGGVKVHHAEPFKIDKRLMAKLR